MFKCKTIILLLVFVCSLDVLTWGSLKSQKVNCFSRYCTYSDGGILTVGSTDLCPINNSAQSKNNGSPAIGIQHRSVGSGSLKSHKFKGVNRYCSYSDGTVLTVGNTDMCPITSR